MNENKTISEIKQILLDLKPILQDRYSIKGIGIFGSYIHGLEHPASDLDILVTFSETPGLIEFIHLENFLSEELGCKVDLVLEEALKPKIGERVKKEVVRL